MSRIDHAPGQLVLNLMGYTEVGLSACCQKKQGGSLESQNSGDKE